MDREPANPGPRLEGKLVQFIAELLSGKCRAIDYNHLEMLLT